MPNRARVALSAVNRTVKSLCRQNNGLAWRSVNTLPETTEIEQLFYTSRRQADVLNTLPESDVSDEYMVEASNIIWRQAVAALKLRPTSVQDFAFQIRLLPLWDNGEHLNELELLMFERIREFTGEIPRKN